MEALTPILVNVLVAVLGVVLMAVLTMLRGFLKAKLSKDQFEFLDRLAEAAVWAIEQQGAGVFSGKKEAAIGLVKTGLAARGLKMSDEIIDATIEANVAQAFHYGKHTKEDEA